MRIGKKNDAALIVLNIVWSVIAVAVNYFMNFLITPYVTNHIGVEAYGFVALATTFTSYVDIISIGLNAFAGRFISVAYHRNEKERANTFYSSVIVADAVLALLVTVPCVLMIRHLESFLQIPSLITTDVKILFSAVLLKYLLTIMRTAFNTATFLSNRLDIYEKHLSFSYLLQAGLLLGLCVLLPPHVWYVGLAGIAAALYLLIINLRLTKKLTPDLRFHSELCSMKAVRELVSAGIWNSLNNFGNVLNSGLDLLITNIMIDAVVLGEISIAKNLGTICYTLITKVSASFRPKQLKLYAEGRVEDQVALFKQTMKITGMLCSLIICVFFCCGQDFLKLWIPNQNIPFIFSITMIVLLSDIAIGVVNPLYYVFTLTKKLQLPCVITIVMGVLNIASMYLLISYTSFGAYAVVLTTLVLNFFHFVDTPLYSAHCLKVKRTTFYPTIARHLVVLCAGAVISRILNAILPEAKSWIMLIFKAGFSAVILSAVFITLMFSRKEIKHFMGKIMEAKKRYR